MSNEEPQTDKRQWLKPFMRRLSPIFREVAMMSFFVNSMALAVPVFSLQVYDRVVVHAGISTLIGLVIGMIVIVLFDFTLRQARSRIMQTVALRIDAVVGQQIFNKFTSLPLNVLESRTGNYWQALFRDVDVVRNTLSGASAILVCDLPFVIMFFGLIWIIAKPIAWVLMFVAPVFLIVTYRAGKATGKASRKERTTTQDRDGLIGEMIHGRATIKALALEGSMRPMWEQRHAENIESAITRGGRTDFFSNLGQSLSMSTSVTMTSVGALSIIHQDITMGALVATNMLSGRLLGPLNQLVNQWRNYASFRQSVDRLGEVFNMTSERQTSEVKLDKPTGRIECHGVTFSYAPGVPPVCDNVTVSFRSGGIHAMVGRNGSGKTTLLKLLQGLYVPSSGRVLLDGADISQFSRAELAQWMGYVPQDSTLFAGTVRDNVVHRFPNATDQQIIRAAKAAGVHDFIIDMPDGYGTEIGEAGQRLSGGQRQRIAIARALIGDPAVLMLDEPSSSLDRHAEHELRDTLKELAKHHTVIIVTHSPVLLAACDNLVALDKGKIALAGPATDILPRLFGAGAKAEIAAPAVKTGESGAPSPTLSAPTPTQVQPQAAATPALALTSATPQAPARKPAQETGAAGGGQPLAAPRFTGAAPSAQPATRPTAAKPPSQPSASPAASQTPASTPKPVPKPAVNPAAQTANKVAQQPLPQPKGPPQQNQGAAPQVGAAPQAGKAIGSIKPIKRAVSAPKPGESALQVPAAVTQTSTPQPSATSQADVAQTGTPQPQPAVPGSQVPQQSPQPPQDAADKRPVAQASPPPTSPVVVPTGDDDDPYTAALRDMIRSEH